MIIVTGTKRSGTSMWMQLLRGAGLPTIGEAFPRDWANTIRGANPAGFWESKLRGGIYHRTNPDPETGTYLFPEATELCAVKVFIPGLIRTDRAFIGRVIATIRPWRQYVRSVKRLYTMEREDLGAESRAPAVFDPALEWWVENFSLISDIVTRRYPFYMVAYDAVLRSPDETLRRVFDWLGVGRADAARGIVRPSFRTQEADDVDAESDTRRFESDVVATFDALYELVFRGEPLERRFVDRLNEVNRVLSDRIDAEVRRVADANLPLRALGATRARC